MREEIFRSNGGRFVTPVKQLREKMLTVKALLFDWDGVFNTGEKGDVPSSFNEVDSMGINMLRFGYFMTLGHIPYTAIVTGETNHTAFRWAHREHLDNVFFQVKHKADLLRRLKADEGIEPHEVFFVFDDILDLSLAAEAGVRMLVNRKSNPLFNGYCVENNLCDYITYSESGHNPIREITEVTLDLLEKFEATIEERVHFEGIYQKFLREKMQIEMQILKSENGLFVRKEIDFTAGKN